MAILFPIGGRSRSGEGAQLGHSREMETESGLVSSITCSTHEVHYVNFLMV